MVEVLALVTAVVVLVTAVTTWLTRRQVQQVHVLVNSRWTAMTERLDQLTEALQGSDTAVPPVPPEREEG